jgi:hypothetical protein
MTSFNIKNNWNRSRQYVFVIFIGLFLVGFKAFCATSGLTTVSGTIKSFDAKSVQITYGFSTFEIPKDKIRKSFLKIGKEISVELPESEVRVLPQKTSPEKK